MLVEIISGISRWSVFSHFVETCCMYKSEREKLRRLKFTNAISIRDLKTFNGILTRCFCSVPLYICKCSQVTAIYYAARLSRNITMDFMYLPFIPFSRFLLFYIIIKDFFIDIYSNLFALYILQFFTINKTYYNF